MICNMFGHGLLKFGLRSVSVSNSPKLRLATQTCMLKNQSKVNCIRRTFSTPSASATPDQGTSFKVPLILTGITASLVSTAVYLLGRPTDIEFEAASADYSFSNPMAENKTLTPEERALLNLKFKTYAEEPTVLAYLYRARDKVQSVYSFYLDPPPEVLLPPLVPPEYRPSEYTLVLDLEDTLIHTEWTVQHGYRIIKRPGMDYFLKYCASNLFEVVVFCDSEIMDLITYLELLDPEHFITHRLFKGHKRTVNGHSLKDLSLLNRDLKKVIIIDDKPANYQLQPNNGVQIKPFTGDLEDKALYELIPFLETIVVTGVPDVRDVLQQYKGLDNVGKTFIDLQALQAERLAQERAAAAAAVVPNIPTLPTSKWFRSK